MHVHREFFKAYAATLQHVHAVMYTKVARRHVYNTVLWK